MPTDPRPPDDLARCAAQVRALTAKVARLTVDLCGVEAELARAFVKLGRRERDLLAVRLWAAELLTRNDQLAAKLEHLWEGAIEHG